MIVNTKTVADPLMLWNEPKAEMKTELLKPLHIAIQTLNRAHAKRMERLQEQAFYDRIKIKRIFKLLKEALERLNIRVAVALLVIALFFAGFPIEELREIVEELVEWGKLDQKEIELIKKIISRFSDQASEGLDTKIQHKTALEYEQDTLI